MSVVALLTVCTTLGGAPADGMASFFHSRSILLGAHRGGRDLWPEDTVEAYSQAAKRWPEILLEGDLHMTKDGQVVVMHDAKVDRTTDGTGPLGGMRLDEIKQLDAGYRFTRDHGQSYPYRGKGITVPTLAEALAAAPGHPFLFEMKEGEGIADATIKIIREAKAQPRVLLASIDPECMRRVRETAPEIGTCYDFMNAAEMLHTLRQGDWAHYTPAAAMLAFSPEIQRQFKVTNEEVQAVRAKGVLIEYFTINSREEMDQCLAIGVDSILSDRPDVLAEAIAAARAKTP